MNASMPFAVSAPFPLASVSICGKAVVVRFASARDAVAMVSSWRDGLEA